MLSWKEQVDAVCVPRPQRVLTGRGSKLTVYDDAFEPLHEHTLDVMLIGAIAMHPLQPIVAIIDLDGCALKLFTTTKTFDKFNPKPVSGNPGLSAPNSATIATSGTPTESTFGEGDILITDSMEHCVTVIDMDGNLRFSFGKRGSGEGNLISPGGLCTSTLRGKPCVVVADTGNDRICWFAADGTFLQQASETTQGTALTGAKAVVVCKRGEIAVACETGDYVVGIDPVTLGEVWRVDSLPEPLEAAMDGASDEGEDDDVETPVQGPFGLGVDEDGMLLVADQHRAAWVGVEGTDSDDDEGGDEGGAGSDRGGAGGDGGGAGEINTAAASSPAGSQAEDAHSTASDTDGKGDAVIGAALPRVKPDSTSRNPVTMMGSKGEKNGRGGDSDNGYSSGDNFEASTDDEAKGGPATCSDEEATGSTTRPTVTSAHHHDPRMWDILPLSAESESGHGGTSRTARRGGRQNGQPPAAKDPLANSPYMAHPRPSSAARSRSGSRNGSRSGSRPRSRGAIAGAQRAPHMDIEDLRALKRTLLMDLNQARQDREAVLRRIRRAEDQATAIAEQAAPYAAQIALKGAGGAANGPTSGRMPEDSALLETDFSSIHNTQTLQIGVLELQSRIEELKAQEGTWDSDLPSLRQRKAVAEGAVQALQPALKEVRKLKQHGQQQLEQELQSLRRDYDRLQEKKLATMRSIEQESASLKAEHRDAKRQLNDLTQRLLQLRQETSDWQALASETQGRKQAMQTKVKQLQKQKAALEQSK